MPTADRATDVRAPTPHDRPLLELRGVRAGYGSVQVLHGIDLSVPAGALVAILGPNGAGKTTTLRVISGLLKPTTGQVLLEGLDVAGTSPARLAKAGVCLIPEGRGIFPNLSVRENLIIDSFASPRAVAGVEELAHAHFPVLLERREQVAGTLSGGEQQMLAISRALTSDPALILIDEPSMGLAPLIVQELYEKVQKLTETGTTIVLVEQFANTVIDFADEVVLISQGKVRFSGKAETAREELTSTYLGGS